MMDYDMERPLHLFTLAADSEAALRQATHEFAASLAATPVAALADICLANNLVQAALPYRLAAMADSTAQLQAQLAAFAADRRARQLVSGRAVADQLPKLAFLFTGQGAQYVGMGRQLYETQPTFRRALDQCAAYLRPYMDQPLLSLIYARGAAPLLDETAYTQPALFALEYALAELWRSWGIEPDVVLGHSVGEYVAACLAGVFSLEDGLRLIALRSRLMQSLPQNGTMAVLHATEAEVGQALRPYQAHVSIASVNGPHNVVISGLATAVEAVCQQFQAQERKVTLLTVSHAFHSPLMEPICDEFEQEASQITFHAPRIPLVSNVTGQVVEAAPTAAYWRKHIRSAVRFAAGMEALAGHGCELFLEIGPHPAVLAMGRLCLPSSQGVWLPTLRKGKEDWHTLLASLGALYVEGVAIDWMRFDQDYRRAPITIPVHAARQTPVA